MNEEINCDEMIIKEEADHAISIKTENGYHIFIKEENANTEVVIKKEEYPDNIDKMEDNWNNDDIIKEVDHDDFNIKQENDSSINDEFIEPDSIKEEENFLEYKNLQPKTSDRKRDITWLSFDEVKKESRKGVRAKCKKCGYELEGHVVRMKSHLLKCAGPHMDVEDSDVCEEDSVSDGHTRKRKSDPEKWKRNVEKRERLSITMSSRESKSLAWRLFKVAVDDQSKAICQLCDAKISRGQKVGSFTTSNMLKHLSIKHPEQLQEEEEKAKKEQEKKRTLPLSFLSDKKLKTPTGLGCSKQLTLQETVDKGKTWDINDVRAQKVHKFIGEMIAIDLQPFSIVEDIGFIRLLNHVCPKYQIPSRKYMKEKIVQDTYDRVRKKIQEEINSANYLSFTSDGWTASTANTSFLSLTAHWISDNYELKSAILRVSPFEGSHTASNISECLKDTLNKFEIPNNKVLVIVRDNAANMAAGVAQAEYESLPCFLHTLQLVLNDAIFEQRYVKDLISVCKQIVGYFNHSPSAFANYADYQKRFDLPPHTFIQDIPTRWNSQYYMLSRVFEQKTGLISYCSDHPKPACLEANQWKILDKLLKILKHFVECTNFLSSREAIASVIIPNIKVICHFFDTAEEKGLFVGLGSTLSAWKVSVETRFGTYLKKKILILATYLDPRFKTTFLEDEYENQNVEKIILQWLYDDINSLNISKSSTDDIGLDTSDPSDNDKSENESDYNFSFGSCFSEFKKKKKVVNNVETDVESTADSSNKKMQAKEKKFKETIKIELIKYQDLKTINKDLSPIQWWNMNKDSFPNMAMLAKKYLCAPPFSIESERLFSVGGNIYSPKRNRVKAETGEMLMFLHYNLSVLGFEF